MCLSLNIRSTVVDSLKPTDIVVSFSSLSYWNEPAVVATKDDMKTPVKLGVRDKSDRESRLGDVPSEAIIPSDTHVVTGNTTILSLLVFVTLYKLYICLNLSLFYAELESG